ncbi:MAG: AraC family transcriptional regulator [Bacteroidales bacterium]|nr:AraC family transcriptional regulator [Bacteroidales bacterium]
MYTLKEAWIKMLDGIPYPEWDGRMYCKETDATITFLTNNTHGYMSAYTFTLILEGYLKILYNNREMILRPHDLYFYSPGMAITVIDASPNYRGICLLADEDTTLRIPFVRDLVSLAYMPIVRLHEPKVELPPEVADRLERKMREIISTLHSDHIYKDEILNLLYSVFLLDLQGAQEQVIREHSVPQRMEELFIDFMRLLPRHFVEHHDIGFYASQLSITPDYLSRIVRRVSGRTVVDYINQLLIMEASHLLTSSTLSISQIADQLHFADTPSFSKFFSRLTGHSPREYRSHSNN